MHSTTPTTASPLASYLRQLQLDMSERSGEDITEVCFVLDHAPMLPAAFAQSVSFDPECSCGFHATFREERWGACAPEEQKGSCQPPKHHFRRASVARYTVITSRCPSSREASPPPFSSKQECLPRAPQRKASFDLWNEATNLSPSKTGDINSSIDSSCLDKCVFVLTRTQG